MNKHILTLALIATTASVATTATAQDLHTSYFMETAKFRHQMNPALLNDAPYVAMPFLGNINVGVQTNLGAKNFIYDIDPATNEGKRYGTFLHPDVSVAQFKDQVGTRNLQATAAVNYNIFSVGFRGFKGTNLVELNLRATADMAVSNKFLQFAKTPLADEHYDFSDIGVRAHSYAELVLGHARRIDHHFTVGAKAKILLGLGFADMKVNQLSATFGADKWQVAGQATGAMALMKTPAKVDANGKVKFGEMEDFQGGLSGWGLGFDLGATYKVHTFEDLTVSLALTDIGFVHHSQAQNMATRKASWEFDGFENAYVGVDRSRSQKLDDELDNLKDEFDDFLSLYDTGKRGHSQALATTFNLGAEYTLPQYRKLSFGFLYSHRFAGLYSWDKAMLSAHVRPLKFVEFGLSTSFSSFGTNVGAMLTLQAPHFQFFVGTDHLVHKLSKQYIPINNASTSFNMGFTFPMGSKKR